MINSDEKRGLIFNIQKFSIHDGSGMRTLLFMKGCPLSCLWCSNPESQSCKIEVMDVKKNCIKCQKCYDICPKGAIAKEDFRIDRSLCDGCGACTQKCYAGAKKSVGQWYSIPEIMEKIEKDQLIYRNSEGGVTVGGGEPILQADFVSELLKACHSVNIHTAVETCGCGSWDNAKKVFDHADAIFFDLKHMDSSQHKTLTGAENRSILQNAESLAKMDKTIVFRLPLIPSFNDSKKNLEETGAFVASLSRSQSSVKIEILPYHNLGQDKYRWLSKGYSLESLRHPEAEHVEACRTILRNQGCNVI